MKPGTATTRRLDMAAHDHRLRERGFQQFHDRDRPPPAIRVDYTSRFYSEIATVCQSNATPIARKRRVFFFLAPKGGWRIVDVGDGWGAGPSCAAVARGGSACLGGGGLGHHERRSRARSGLIDAAGFSGAPSTGFPGPVWPTLLEVYPAAPCGSGFCGTPACHEELLHRKNYP